MQQQQAQANQAYMNQLNQIYNDEDYTLVKDLWEKHQQNPNTMMRLQSGQATVTDEYNKLVRAYFRGVAKQSHEALKVATKGGKTPPHVEAGTPPAPPAEEGENPRTKMEKIAKDSQGGDDDLDKLIEAAIPKGDAIFDMNR